jgi:hypothetical protein
MRIFWMFVYWMASPRREEPDVGKRRLRALATSAMHLSQVEERCDSWLIRWWAFVVQPTRSSTMRSSLPLRVARYCVIPALLLLPQIAPAAAAGLVETFNAICTDTFPSFRAMGDKVEALGGHLEPSPEPVFSRVPLVVPKSAKTGSTDKRHMNPLDDMAVDYAEGVVFDLPAAGCSIGRRSGIDEATIAQLLNSFETAIYLGIQKGTFTGGGPYRAWVVGLKGRMALLTILEPKLIGNAKAVMVSLVRWDEKLINLMIKGSETTL